MVRENVGGEVNLSTIPLELSRAIAQKEPNREEVAASVSGAHSLMAP